jgi:diacylglycerol kinase (ATP)
MRATLVHNPSAGDRRHSPKRILRELADAGYEAEVAPRDKKAFRNVMEDPGELVVVAGGDGSIKQVAVALLGRSTPMAILPIGTANNIAKSLRITGSVGELIAGWKHGRRIQLTVGTVSAPFGTMRFVESVGAGVFTELVVRGKEVKQNPDALTGHTIDRAIQLLHRIVQDRDPSPRALVVDGQDLSGEYLLVEVMNTSMVGPNVPLAPDANFEDDQLDVVTVTEKERGLLAEYLEARLHGGAEPPRLTVRQGERVTMRASARELHVDDAPWDPDKADDARAARAGEDEGDVNVTLGTSVEVVIGPPTPPKA